MTNRSAPEEPANGAVAGLGLAAGQAAHRPPERTRVQGPRAATLGARSGSGGEARAYSAVGDPLSGVHRASADGRSLGLGLSRCPQEATRREARGRRRGIKTRRGQTDQVRGAEEEEEEGRGGSRAKRGHLPLTLSPPLAVAVAQLAARLTPE